MTKYDMCMTMLRAYELLSMDYYEYLKSNDLFKLCNIPNDVYSVMTTQKKECMGILKAAMLSAHVLSINDISAINNVDYKPEPTKPQYKENNVYQFPYPEYDYNNVA